MGSYENCSYLSGRAMTTHNSEQVHDQRPNSSVPQNAGTARVNGEIGPKILKQKTFFK